MEKMQGYDEAQALTGEFETLEPGGYICVIKKAKEETSTTGKKMLVIAFDIAEGEHAGFYQRRFDDLVKTNPDTKPASGGVLFWCLVGDFPSGDKLRLPGGKTAKNRPTCGGAAFWCLVGDSNPGHPA